MRPWLLAPCLLAALPAAAAPYRVGVFVGNNHGQSGDLPLRFATSDAEKMHDLFVDVGAIDPSDAILLRDGTARQVERTLEQLAGRLAKAAEAGDETHLVFYYSGHGDADALHLGTTQLAHHDLRTWLEATGADVRLALVDACQSGGLVRAKGGTRGPSFDFAVEVEKTRGTAVLTSSAISELSQESLEVGGGFFTHYLHTALTGGADRDRDGVVTLTEAYTYVHTETAFGTRDTPGSQTPSFDFDLVGAGDLVLTELEAASSALAFLGDLPGTFSVWDESRKRYVAEVDGTRTHTLAVRPGTYYVHHRLPGWVDEARYVVRRGETRSVFEEDFTSVTYDAVASRGDLERIARRARLPDLTVRLVAGLRSFRRDSVWDLEYLPQHSVGGLEARFIGPAKPWWGVDLLTGGGQADLVFDEVGSVAAQVASTSVSGSVGYATGPRLIRAGIGGRTQLLWMQRRFPERDADDQSTVAFAAGGIAWVGLHHGRFTGDIGWASQLMFHSFDDTGQWPVISELTLALGVRF